MKVDLSREELLAALAGLRYLEGRYSRDEVPLEYLKEADQDLRVAVEGAMADVRRAIEKLEASLSGDGGGYVFVYVPDGIRDRELEIALKERIPEESAVFWSTKFSNFVVEKRYAHLAEEAIRGHYGDDKTIDKDPDWASKKDTWQIVGKKRRATRKPGR